MCQPYTYGLPSLTNQPPHEDPTARLLREKYGIAKPFADDEADDSYRPEFTPPEADQ